MRCNVSFLIPIVGLLLFTAPVPAQTGDGATAMQLLQEAVKLQNAGKYAEASGKWLAFIKDYPKDAALGQAYTGLGTCLLETGQLNDSITAFHEAIKLLPKEETGATVRWNLAVAYYRRADQSKKAEHYVEAAKALEAIAVDVQAPAARHSLATYYLAKTEQAQGKVKEARQRLEDLLAKPRDPAIVSSALLALGGLALDVSDWPTAIRHYRAFLKDHEKLPGADQARLGLADALLESGQEAEGVKVLTEICQRPESEPADYGLYRLGGISLTAAKAKEAVAYLDLHLKHHAKSEYRPQVLGLLGQAHYQLKEYDQAAAILDQQLREFPKLKERASSELLLAQALFAGGKVEQAEAVAMRLREARGDEELSASVRLLSARIAVSQGKAGEAQAHFQAVLASKAKLATDEATHAEAVWAAFAAGDGKRGLLWTDEFQRLHAKSERGPAVQYQAARWLAEQGQFQDSLTRCLKLLETKDAPVQPTSKPGPMQPNALYLAGHCSQKLRQFEEGAKYYRRLIKEFPKFEQLPEARYSLAVCEESRGATSLALTAYQEFLKAHPEHTLADAVKERVRLLQK